MFMKEFPFVGRTKELARLKDLTNKRSASLVVVQGRRRIGKSRLVQEFAKDYRFLSFAGIAPNTNTDSQKQKDEFARQLSANLNYTALRSGDWADLFSSLARETSKGKVVILFDEISWMAEKSSDFLGKLKNTWDLEFKENPELILILCGSVSSWIDKNILSSTGFMGRLSLILHLKELKLQECNMLLNKISFCDSTYERFKMLSVTGGVPRYLEEINSKKLADENVKDLCFKSSGILFREFKDIFSDIFSKRAAVYESICRCLAEGSKEYMEISKILNIPKSGHLSEYLSDLIKSGFIRRDYTWNIKSKKESRLSHYRLSDNYLRFYLRYIEPNKGRIENEHYQNKSLSTLPGISSIFGLQFENLVLNNRDSVIKKLNIAPEDIILDNPYFQKRQVRAPGCQIDYLIQTRSNILFACEIKFSRDIIRSDVIESMKQKLDNFRPPKNYAVIPVLIYCGEISSQIIESEYFGYIINFEELTY